MPRNGSGNYSLPTNAWNPAINGVSATPGDWQALINDVAAAIQASVSADGQTPVTGNLQMGGHLLTGAGAPSGTGMSLRWEQLTRGADIPSATSITIPLEGQFFAVTGSTPITGFNATIAGRLVYIKFDAGIVLTNSASFILPGGVNITTQADDIAVFLSVSIGVWECVSYPRVQNSAAQWLGTPVGGYVALRDDLVGVATPPTNNAAFRYVKLTASDAYNTGVLTSESVSGAAPLVIATAVISLAGSPLNGQTINLWNTERRSPRAGNSGVLEDDAVQSHDHQINIKAANGAEAFGMSTFGSASGGYYATVVGSQTGRISNETRVRNQGVTYYMRVL